jgi:hypothetical protein
MLRNTLYRSSNVGKLIVKGQSFGGISLRSHSIINGSNNSCWKDGGRPSFISKCLFSAQSKSYEQYEPFPSILITGGGELVSKVSIYIYQ